MTDLRERIQNLSPEQRQLLEQRLVQQRPSAAHDIPHVDGPGPFPLSFAQQRMWFLHALNPDDALYNMPLGIRMRGALDVQSLERSVNEVVRRHAVLRTRFPLVGDRPQQQISPYAPFAMPVVRLDAALESREECLRAAALEATLEPFDLTNGPVFRAKLFAAGDSDHVFLMTVHHIAADGWSLDVIAREIERSYSAFRAGDPSPLADLRIQYSDYALWQPGWLQTANAARQTAYWKDRLRGIEPLHLVTDRPRPLTPSHRSGRADLKLTAAITAAVNAFTRDRGVTLYMALLATFQTLLHRHTGQTDIVIGSPVDSRRHVAIENHVGNFINTVALRGDLSGEPTFSEVLARAKKSAIEAFDNQDVPFEQLVQELQPERTSARTPIFQAMLALDGKEQDAPEFAGLTSEWYRIPTGRIRFELSLTIRESEGQLVGFLDYDRELFDAPRMEFMARHFVLLLEAMAADPSRRISLVPLLGEEETRLLVSDWNPTGTQVADEATFTDLFEAQVDRAGNVPAVRDSHGSITYAGLDALSNRLAKRLVAAGVSTETRVGIGLGRSRDTIVSILATLKAGGAFVPLGVDLPADRLRYMLGDGGIHVVVCNSTSRAFFEGMGVPIIDLDDLVGEQNDDSSRRLERQTTGRNLAYVIFTSGSTGRPKGVAVEHRSLLNYLHWVNRALTPAGSTIPWVTRLSFDASLKQTLAVLLRGDCIDVVPNDTDPAQLLAKLGSGEWSGMNCVPSLWRVLLDELEAHPEQRRKPGDFQLYLGGEGFSDQLVTRTRQVLPQVTVWNLYGPTEATANATAGVIAPHESIHMGRPVANGSAYVVNSSGLPQPLGAPGELVIGGVPVARGYWGHPDLTADRFVPSSWGPAGSVVYRTGDLVRHTSGGNLQFLGRLDQQIKVRGFRIEPAEVESALIACDGVGEALVLASGSNEAAQLRAYVVPADDRVLEVGRIRQALALRLPDYMVPSSITILKAFPLNHAGKVDRSALPLDGARTESEASYSPPKSPIEKELVNLWEKLLDRKPIGVNDNFFDLGGHSLLAVSLFQRIERTYNRRLPLATLFQAPTIELLAQLIADPDWAPSWTSLVPLHAEGSLPPFFCFHAVGGNVLNYSDLARHLGKEQPVWGVQAFGVDRKSDPLTSVEEMASRYIREIRSVQPIGPYYLGGASSGGLVAYEVARQLHAAGDRVGIVALFDTYAPGFPRQIPGATRFRKFVNYQRERVSQHMDAIRGSKGRERFVYIAKKTWKLKFMLQQRVRWKIKRMRGLAPERNAPYHPDFKNVNLALIHAFKEYEAKPYPGAVTIFRATEQPLDCYFDPDLGWNTLVGAWSAIEIKGHHGAIILDPRAAALAEKLREALRNARQSSEPALHG